MGGARLERATPSTGPAPTASTHGSGPKGKSRVLPEAISIRLSSAGPRTGREMIQT